MATQRRVRTEVTDLVINLRQTMSRTRNLCDEATKLLETAEGLAVELREIRELRENFACQIEEMKVHAEWLSKQSGLIINRLDK